MKVKTLAWFAAAACAVAALLPAVASAEVVDRILGELKIPVLSGLTIGHTDDQLTLPLGVMAEMDAGLGTLTITEPATTAFTEKVRGL